MNFEDNIKKSLGLKKKITNKKSDSKEKDFSQMSEDYVKKFTIVVFVAFIGYSLYSANEKGNLELPKAFNKTEEILAEDNSSQDKGAKGNIVVKDIVKNNPVAQAITNKEDIKQESFTIISPDFISKINKEEYLFLNLTKKNNNFFNEGNNILEIINIKNNDGSDYFSNFDILDKNKKYVIFIENISDINSVKNSMKSKGFQNVFFKIVK